MIDTLESLPREYGIRIHSNGDETIIMNTSCLSFLNSWCEHYASTYKDRRMHARKLLHIVQNAPILIHEQDSILFFPTNAEPETCVWIQYMALLDVIEEEDNCTRFIFTSGYEVSIAITYRSAYRQIHYCNLYLYMLGCHRNAYMISLQDRQ